MIRIFVIFLVFFNGLLHVRSEQCTPTTCSARQQQVNPPHKFRCCLFAPGGVNTTFCCAEAQTCGAHGLCETPVRATSDAVEIALGVIVGLVGLLILFVFYHLYKRWKDQKMMRHNQFVDVGVSEIGATPLD